MLKLLRRAASEAAESAPRDSSAHGPAMARREFIQTVSTVTAGLTLPVSLFATKQITTDARVVVVGAGLAGLTCAYRLKQHGVTAAVYEANTRINGRVGPDVMISTTDK